jgi:hypothetical protein
MDELLIRLRLLLPGQEAATDSLLTALLDQAGDMICGYAGHALVPEALTGAQLRLAVIAYNRLGMEGETYRHEGGLTLRSAALPDDLLNILKPYRLLKVPGP